MKRCTIYLLDHDSLSVMFVLLSGIEYQRQPFLHFGKVLVTHRNET